MSENLNRSVVAEVLGVSQEVIAPLFWGDDPVVDATDSSGMTLVHHAAENGLVEWIARLRELGFNMDKPSNSGITPLSLCISRNRGSAPATVNALLHAGADPHFAPPLHDSPLVLAKSIANPDVLDALFSVPAKLQENSNAEAAPSAPAAGEELGSTIATPTAKVEGSDTSPPLPGPDSSAHLIGASTPQSSPVPPLHRRSSGPLRPPPPTPAPAPANHSAATASTQPPSATASADEVNDPMVRRVSIVDAQTPSDPITTVEGIAPTPTTTPQADSNEPKIPSSAPTPVASAPSSASAAVTPTPTGVETSSSVKPSTTATPFGRRRAQTLSQKFGGGAAAGGGEDADAVSSITFTRWLNAEASRAYKALGAADSSGAGARPGAIVEPPALDNLAEDVSSGYKLLCVFAALYPEAAPAKIGSKPLGRIASLDTAQRALDVLTRAGVKWSGTSAQHIVDMDRKFILGLVWSLIYARRLAGDGDGVAGKKGLLLWVQQRLKAEDPSITVSDFTSAWQDGTALVALVRSVFGDVGGTLSPSVVDSLSATERVVAALSAAVEKGVPKLVEPEWVVSAVDERALITYLSELFFAAKRVGDSASVAAVAKSFLEAAASVQLRAAEYAEATRVVDAFSKAAPTQDVVDELVAKAGEGAALDSHEETKGVGAVAGLVPSIKTAVALMDAKRQATSAMQSARAAVEQLALLEASTGIRSPPLHPAIRELESSFGDAVAKTRAFVVALQTARVHASANDSARWAHVKAQVEAAASAAAEALENVNRGASSPPASPKRGGDEVSEVARSKDAENADVAALQETLRSMAAAEARVSDPSLRSAVASLRVLDAEQYSAEGVSVEGVVVFEERLSAYARSLAERQADIRGVIDAVHAGTQVDAQLTSTLRDVFVSVASAASAAEGGPTVVSADDAVLPSKDALRDALLAAGVTVDEEVLSATWKTLSGTEEGGGRGVRFAPFAKYCSEKVGVGKLSAAAVTDAVRTLAGGNGMMSEEFIRKVRRGTVVGCFWTSCVASVITCYCHSSNSITLAVATPPQKFSPSAAEFLIENSPKAPNGQFDISALVGQLGLRTNV